MSTQIAIRLSADEVEALDTEVRAGRAASRSDAVRRSISHLTRAPRYRNDEAILVELDRRGEPVYPDLDSLYDVPRVPLD